MVKNKKTNPKNSYDGVIVLEVYLHCEACVRTVLKALRGFDGVEEVEPKPEENRVIVKGTACDPDRIAARVSSKLGKSVKIISPVQIKIKQEKKPEMTETVLKINMHCDGCAKKVRHCVLKMEGVQSAEPDMNASTVTIKGTVDPKDLIVRIKKKTGKNAEVVIPKKQKGQDQDQKGKNQDQKGQNQNQKGQNQNQKGQDQDQKGQNQDQKGQNQNQKGQNQDQKGQNQKGQNQDQKGQNQNQNDGEEMDNKKKDERNIGLSYPNDPSGLVYATEILSDENPNACSIM